MVTYAEDRDVSREGFGLVVLKREASNEATCGFSEPSFNGMMVSVHGISCTVDQGK